MDRLILGTRGSALALAQAALTEAALATIQPRLTVERRIFITQGDRKLDLNLLQRGDAGGKGLFTRELETALLDGTMDIAVHSLKDLPGHNPDGLEISAVLPRAPNADTLVSKIPGGLDALPRGATVGTSSIRRARQLTWLRPDIKISEWRGNVPTRLRKLAASESATAIILAEAGLRRLGFDLANGVLHSEGAPFHTASLGDVIIPAIGQGVVAIQSRADRAEVRALVAQINHAPTMLAVRAEREVQRLLGGDCSMPVGVRTTLDRETLRLEGILFDNETAPRRAEASGTQPETVAAQLVARLRA